MGGENLSVGPLKQEKSGDSRQVSLCKSGEKRRRGRGRKAREKERSLSVTQFEDLQRQLQFEYNFVSPQDVMHLNQFSIVRYEEDRNIM